jgi:hypothetical protein
MLQLIITNYNQFLQTLKLMTEVALIPNQITDRQDFIINKIGSEHIKKFADPTLAEIVNFIEWGMLPVATICQNYIPRFEALIETKEQFHDLFNQLAMVNALALCRYQEHRLVQLIPEYEVFKYYMELLAKSDKSIAMIFITERMPSYFIGIFKEYSFSRFVENLTALEDILPGANAAILNTMPEFVDISAKGIMYFCQALKLAVDPWALAKKFFPDFYVDRLNDVDSFRGLLTIIQFRHRLDFCKLLPPQKIESLINSTQDLGKILSVLTVGEVRDDISAVDIMSQFLKYIDKKKLVNLVPTARALIEIEVMLMPELHESLGIIVTSYIAEKTTSIKVDRSVSSKDKERELSHSSSRGSVRLAPAEELKRSGSASFFSHGVSSKPVQLSITPKPYPGIPFIEHYEVSFNRSKSSV